MNHSFNLRILASAICLVTGLLGTRATSASFDHAIYDALLKAHVEDGLVNYKAVQKDPRLNQYLELLASIDPDSLEGRNENMAFWINAYNAYTLKLITDYYPVSSILEIKEKGFDGPWKIPMAKVGGKNYTLDQIEHEILRPRWPDPRIHYAVVCAALSCPQLRSEAYTANRLEVQLNEQAAWFMIHRNQFNRKKRTASLSKIFEWYAVDFGKTQTDTLQSLIPHIDEDLANDLRKHAKKWKVDFVEWDWRLNERQ